MYVNVSSHQAETPETVISLRCPACRQRVTMERIGGQDIRIPAGASPNCRIGYRRCPDPKCKALLFFVENANGTELVCYPSERIDFDATNVPPDVLKALKEAITCHANECFIAAAIMVRKTLEELCRDRGATGANLKERIAALRSKVVLPDELLEALDHLRLLGNDAAHFESRVFDQVGKEEVEVGIEVAKEVLKAVYQYVSILGKLKALMKPASTT